MKRLNESKGDAELVAVRRLGARPLGMPLYAADS
jgi:hypothetical protein